MTLVSLCDRLDTIKASLAAAREAVAAGTPIDLTGLDVAIAEACKGAQEIPPNGRPTVIAALQSLADELNGLASSLAAAQSKTP